MFDIGKHSKINVVTLYIILMHISYFMLFFANDLVLVCFIFILDYRKDVRQKANLSNFFIQVQNGPQSSGDNSQHQQAIWPRNC